MFKLFSKKSHSKSHRSTKKRHGGSALGFGTYPHSVGGGGISGGLNPSSYPSGVGSNDVVGSAGSSINGWSPQERALGASTGGRRSRRRRHTKMRSHSRSRRHTKRRSHSRKRRHSRRH